MTAAPISADSHVLEPGDLWLSRLSAAYEDVAPRIVETGRGDGFTFDDHKPWQVGVEFAAGQGEAMVARDRRWADAPLAGWDALERIKAQEIDGVASEVLYPTLGLYLYRASSEHQQLYFDVYNEWLAEFCSAYPERLLGIGMVSTHDISAAVAAMGRIKELGLRGVMLPSRQRPEYYDPRYDPLWETAEALGLPVSFHVGTGEHILQHRGRGAGGMNIWRTGNNLLEPLVFLVWSGAYERHPGLRTGFIEGGISWVASTLDQLDDIYHQHQWIEPKLPRPPSSYWRTNCFATFERSRVGLRLTDISGVETLLWASDYPHAESTWPNSLAVIDSDFAALTSDERASITRGNVSRLYDLAPAGEDGA